MSSRDNEQDFAQFTGRFDQAVSPSSLFAATLRRKVNLGSSLNAPAFQRTTVQAFSDRTPHFSHEPKVAKQRARWIGLRMLEIAAAILLISTVAFSAYVVYTIGGPANVNDLATSSRQGAQPEAGALEASDKRHLSGASGENWYYPALPFEAITFETAQITDDPRFNAHSVRVVGNRIVQVGTFTESDYGDAVISTMWATDVETGDVVWTANADNISPNIAVLGDTIYAVQTLQRDKSLIATLIAHSLNTGERRFGGIQLPVIESGEDIGPIAVGDVVFVADSLGTVIAVDATKGTVAWQTEGDRGATAPPSRTTTGATGGSLVADSTSVYVVTGAGRVRKLDQETGEIIGDWDVTANLDLDVRNVELINLDEGKVIARINGEPTPGMSDGETPRMTPEAIVAVDTASGSVDVMGQFSEVSGNIVVTHDRLMIPARNSAEAPIDLVMIPLSSGSERVIPAISASRTLSLTGTGARGDVVILIENDGLLQIGQISDANDLEIVASQPTRSIQGSGEPLPAIISGGRAFVVNESGRLIALRPLHGPGVEATPE